jgi:tetratricopeptide (TPR) repeat protein
MPDSRRLESHQPPEAADRDSRAEALLVEGLDRYFAGNYEEAIHVWTRVLFLDRSHARARAYIDRARTALAERQRQAEEMLHVTSELLAQGRTDQARDLLMQAVAATGDDERAAELRSRLERIERARGGPLPRTGPAGIVVDAVPIGRLRSRRRPTASQLLAGGTLAVGVGLIALIAGAAVQDWLGFSAPSSPLPPVRQSAPLSVLSTSEAALIRARTLYARGRLAEALQALARVDPDSPSRGEGDRLRVEIQQILLSNRRGSAAAGADADRGSR